MRHRSLRFFLPTLTLPTLMALWGCTGDDGGAPAATTPGTTGSTSGSSSGSDSGSSTSGPASEETAAGGDSGGTTTHAADASTSSGDESSTSTGVDPDTSSTSGSVGSSDGDSSSTGEAQLCGDAPIAGSGAVTQAISLGPNIWYADDVGVDADGNVFVAGTVVDGSFGATTLEGDALGSMYLAKFDASLEPLWAQLVDTNFQGATADIEIDDNGDVISAGAGLQKINGVTGLVEWTGDNVGTMTVLPGGDVVVRSQDVVRRRSGADASVVWETTIQPLVNTGYADALRAGTDRLLLTSRFSGTIATAAGNVSSMDDAASVVLSLDLDGNLEWGFPILDDAAWVRDIGVDPCGGAYVYGGLDGIADFGPLGEQGGADDAFLVHLDADGIPEWIQLYFDDGNFEAVAMAVDSEGSALLTGFAESLDLDGIVVGGTDDINGFVAKVNRDGDVVWATHFDAPFSNFNSGITVDASDNPIVVGEFGTAITIGAFSFAPDFSNIFVATMEP